MSEITQTPESKVNSTFEYLIDKIDEYLKDNPSRAGSLAKTYAETARLWWYEAINAPRPRAERMDA